MPIIIRNPSLSVEEIIAEPDTGYNETSGKVPVLAITVAYEVMITGMHTLMPPGLGFREGVQVKGTKVSLSFDFLPVIRGQGDQTFPREHTRLVEKKFITDDLGVLGSIPIQANITIAVEPDPRLSQDTNIVYIAGAQYRSTAAVAKIANAVFWIRDQLFGRMSPDRDG